MLKEKYFDESIAKSITRVTRLYINYPFENYPFAASHFGKETFQNEYTYVQMKKGAPFMNKMTTILERMHSMGFDDYFTWKRLPVEATDWGTVNESSFSFV